MNQNEHNLVNGFKIHKHKNILKEYLCIFIHIINIKNNLIKSLRRLFRNILDP